MDASGIAALYAAATLNAAIPGPCIMLTIGSVACGGIAAGARVSAGILGGDIVLLLVALGATFGALTVSEHLFSAMRWAGVATLLFIALRMLMHRPAAPNAPRHGHHEGVSDGVAGLMVGMLSPFNLVFMLALLPLFIPSGSPDLGDAATICATVLAATLTAQTGATLVGAGALGLTASRTRWMERGCAVSLIAFAVAAVVSPIG